MKKRIFLLILFWLFCKSVTIYGQNNQLTLAESSFEYTPFRIDGKCKDNDSIIIEPCEFCPQNRTGRWRAVHATPNINGVGTCVNSATVSHSGSNHANMFGNDDPRVEGIFISLPFSKEKYYTISFWVFQNGVFSAKLANGLVAMNCAPNNCSSPPLYPPSTTDFLILFDSVHVTGSGWNKFEITVQPNKDFSQLYFHCQRASSGNFFEFELDDVVVVENCCLKEAKYQDTIDPPSTYRFELIEAGSYVFPNQFNGPVYFTMPWETVWQAGELDSNGVLQGEVVMKDGFSSGTNFVARVHDCLTTEPQVNLRYTVEPLQVGQEHCVVKIFADVCFTSGEMVYYVWNLTTGHPVTAVVPTNGGIRITQSPNQPTEYEITVIDKVRGDTIIKTIKVGRCGCFPPTDVPGVSKINNICGPSATANCFNIGMELPPNTAFTWVVDPPLAYSYITDPTSHKTTVCLPPNAGDGIYTFKLFSQNPNCPPDSTLFNVFVKRVPNNNCFFYNGFWGPTDLNDSNKLTLGFDVSLEVEAVYIELYEDGNPNAVYSTELIRGIDILAYATYHDWAHYFGEDVSDGIPYTVVMKYKCRCSNTINIGRIRNINF